MHLSHVQLFSLTSKEILQVYHSPVIQQSQLLFTPFFSMQIEYNRNYSNMCQLQASHKLCVLF